MIGTASLSQLVRLTQREHCRLALVGDPWKLQAVGRGGLFNELCATGRTHELTRIHRFRQPWEAAASLQLRDGNPAAVAAYDAHDRIIASTFEAHLDDLAHHWCELTQNGRSFVLLGGYGGLRLGEMVGLRWGRVDLLRRRIQVAETLVDIEGHIHFGPPKTKASVRALPLARFVCDELSLLAEAGVAPDTLVFQSPDGFPIRPTLFRRRFWGPAARAADLEPLRIHDLRHTAVSL